MISGFVTEMNSAVVTPGEPQGNATIMKKLKGQHCATGSIPLAAVFGGGGATSNLAPCLLASL